MLQSKIGRNFVIVFLLINILLIGGFVYAVLKRPDLLSSMLPGKFGPAPALDLSGNMLFLAILLLVNAALFVLFGITGTSHGLFAGLRISPRKMRWLLHERVGLANDISGIVAEAVQEEEKDEIWYLGMTRGLLLIGLILFAASVPALCIAYTHAAPDGATIFENGGNPVSNGAVSQDTILRFTADQLAGGLLLDIPEVFHLRATPVETNGANLGLGVLVVLYRALIGFGLLLWFVAGRRIASLRDFVMEVAMPAADIVAMEPMLQDGHGHHETDHHPEPAHDHGHHEHESHEHKHEDRGHDDHGHGSGDHGDHHGHDAHHEDHHTHGDHGADNSSSSESSDEEADDDADTGDADAAETSDHQPSHDDHDTHGHSGSHAVHPAEAHGDHHTHASGAAHVSKAEETV